MNIHQHLCLSGVWHVILPDASEGIIVNGVTIMGTYQGVPILDVKVIAEAIAGAQGVTVKRAYLPQPARAQWAWSDIPDGLAACAVSTVKRCSVMIICAEQCSGRAVHFCCHPVLSGSNHDLWFSVLAGETWFQAVERIMVMNHQALNVVRLDPVNSGESYLDQRVIYNGPTVEFELKPLPL